MQITLLDGPLGTRLIEQGHACPAPAWSAQVLQDCPEAIEKVHREYAKAGATVHTANTFRTRYENIGDPWIERTAQAVRIARASCPHPHRIAGSMAPIADCYRPDLSPPDAKEAHRLFAARLAHCGVDLILCETFPHIPEALMAVEAGVETGVETWVSFTAGPNGDLLQPEEIRKGAEQAVKLGAQAILINCVPATQTLHFLQAIRDVGVPFGAYANAGHPEEGIGWNTNDLGPNRYAELAQRWVDAGATLIGACCGTGPKHIEALRTRLHTPR